MAQRGIWGWNTSTWRKITVDAAGHLQVDVLTSALPAGGATAANQALIIADTGTLIAEQGRCYGYDGANWQRLLVESAASANLRTRLYDGVNPIISVGTAADIAATNRGLFTQAGVRGWDGTFWKAVNVEDGAGDALTNARASLSTVSKLYGYNGSTWDRLRLESSTAFNLRAAIYDGANRQRLISIPVTNYTSTGLHGMVVMSVMSMYYSATVNTVVHSSWSLADGASGHVIPPASLWGYNGATYDRLRTYGTGILKVGRAEVGLLDIRLVAVGPVGAAGARKLYWMLLNPSAGNSILELTDAIAAGAAVKADHFDTTRDGHMVTFDPPLEFSIGIYLETFTNMTSITFGYL